MDLSKTFDLTPHCIDASSNSILSLLEKNGIPPASKGNTISLITSDVAAYEEMLKQIAKARYSIDICTYVFKFDQTTEALLEALRKRAQEGIKVRLLLDIVGSFGMYINQRKFKALKKSRSASSLFHSYFKKTFSKLY